MNANSGYIGWSMSVRASQAYSDNKFPKTNFKKHYSISEKVFTYLLENNLVESEWHHTSKFFNKTYFYELSLAGLIYLKSINNSAAITELKKIARERLNRKFRYYPLCSTKNYHTKISDCFNGCYSTALLSAIWRSGKKPNLTPSFINLIKCEIEKTGVSQDAGRRSGRRKLEEHLTNFLNENF